MSRVKSNYGKESFCGSQLVLDLYPDELLRTQHRGRCRRTGSSPIGRKQLPAGPGWKQVRRSVSRLSEAAVIEIQFDQDKERLVVDVLMAKAKTCKNSKGCGNSCVSSSYLCRLELSESDTKKIDTFTDQLISRGSDLKTPEEAAEWFEKNKDLLAEGGRAMRNYGDSNPDFLFISTEYGGDPTRTHYDDQGNLQDRFRGTGAPESVSMPMSKQGIADWYDRNPVAWANAHKQAIEADVEANGGKGSNLFPKVDTGVVLADKSGLTSDSGGMVSDNTAQGWASRSQRYFQRSGKLASAVEGVKTVGTINLSPLQVNTANSWPPKGLPLSKDSPLKTREKWLDYSSQKLAQETATHLRNNPAKVVYVSGNTKAHSKFFDTLHKELSPGSNINTNNSKKTRRDGVEQTVRRRSFTYVDPNTGAKKVVVQGMHPSAQSFSNEELAIIAAMMNSGLG